MRILLEFSPEQTAVHRKRLTYAFRLFCAIYGHEPLLSPRVEESADVRISYSPGQGPGSSQPQLRLSNLYRPRSPQESAPSPRQYVQDGEATSLFYDPIPGEQPDWLAEIFEWVSCADEYSVRERDSVDRVPFEASYYGRHNLDPRMPYAAVAMRFLQKALNKVVVKRGQGRARGPVEGIQHFIIPTHDVDYLPAGRFTGVVRLLKNAALSCLQGKDIRLGISQGKMAVRRSLDGHDPLDQIPNILQGEKQRGVSASYYFLVRHLHRRDADYTLDTPWLPGLLRTLEAQGEEVGVHGSYTCLDTPNGLLAEYNCMRAQGFHPQGGRQHWLRFTLDRLIEETERSGALYDTSIGWPENVGFRAGACFAFPPYIFREERAANFIEIPMAIMDWTLRIERGGREADCYNEVAHLLETSRQYGWGGISLLWHPAAFGGGWLSPEIGRLYWQLMDQREAWNDTWVSASSFVQAVRQRYVDVGLLPVEHYTVNGENENHQHQVAAA